MEDTKTIVNEKSTEQHSFSPEGMAKYLNTPITFTVSYNVHNCIGNLDEGEEEHYAEGIPRTFTYPFFDMLASLTRDYNGNRSYFILSSYKGSDVLIPLKYEVTPCWSIRRFCTTNTNSIDTMIFQDGKKAIVSKDRIRPFHDGAARVTANDDYTSEDAKKWEGLELNKYNCRYDEAEHLIKGDIGKFVDTLFPIFKKNV